MFDELSDTLCKVADLAEFIRVAHPSSSYSQAAQVACAAVSSVVEKYDIFSNKVNILFYCLYFFRLNTHYDLYKVLKEVVTKGDKFLTNEIDNHVASLFLFDFEQSGIHLSKFERQKVVALNDAILNLGQQFVTASATPRYANRSLIPDNLKYL